MTAQQLKNSILQMAVQGKLVPQDPNDEPASVLLDRIRAEKEQLIKEKKIKKEKNPSIIFRGADNLPYEKVGKNEPVCIADEVPFEIPDSWEWVRLGSIGETNIGLTYKPADICNSGIGVLRSNNIQNGMMDYSDLIYVSCDVPPRAMAQKGDILICARNGSRALVGKSAIVDRDGIAFGAFMAIFRSICNPYIQLFINSYLFRGQLDGATTTTINQVTQSMLRKQLCPLPPLEEQKRIVKKYNELLPLITKYEKVYTATTKLQNDFPAQLKRSILQWAVQGKLVPQDPSDEPAEALVERIRAEKLRLIKEGKIKQDKHESVIFRRDNSHYEKVGLEETCIDNELPFDIPDTWSWVRFSDIAIFENGDRSNKYPVEADYVSDGIPFFGAKDMGDKYMEFSTVRFITQEKFAQLGNGKLQNGDLVCLLRGSVGKTRIFKESEKYSTGFICAQMMIIRCLDLNILDYLYALINSPYYCKAIESKITGTAVRQLPAREVANILIPLPPLNEQFRIIEKLSEIFFDLQTL